MAEEFQTEEHEEGAPEWIVTFADMMSLLLTFFILLLSFASMDAEKFKAVAESLRESFTFTAMQIPGMAKPASNADQAPEVEPEPEQIQASIAADPDPIASHREEVRKKKLRDIKKKVDEFIESVDLDKVIKTKLSDKGLVIVNSDPLSFPPASADLSNSSIRYLEALLPTIMDSDFNVIVEGHTDDRPIETEEFPSNWELSTARASRFARYLIERGISPRRLSVKGFAENQPIVPNSSEENRAKNRRIEILLALNDEQALSL